MAGGRLVSTLLWQWRKNPGLERFALVAERVGWVLEGTIVTLGPRGPAVAEYTIRCDALWGTRSARIRLSDDRGERSLHVTRSRHGWFVEGRRLDALAGC